MSEDYLNWKEYKGRKYRERADATTDIFERNIIEARYNWAITRLRKNKVKNVLDIGCGLGYGTNLISKAGFEVEGIDKSSVAVEVARSRYPDTNFIIREFPQNIKNYDAVIALEVIEHVLDYKSFIADCLSLLKDNGVLLLSTPNSKYTKKDNPHHVRVFNLKELRVLFPMAKIRVLLIRLRGESLLLLFMSKNRLQQFMFACSRIPIIHQLPQYSRYFLVEVKKRKR